ncbi:unnamed protein product [Echinostoma caproni]|uniref:CAP-Gly domain-containing protein n=1 Tax=Echinostoma caproni TaxID=27848 RepID=A0A183A3H3_9TREM|nr:unnamed protein product [Echinostoma caproni]
MVLSCCPVSGPGLSVLRARYNLLANRIRESRLLRNTSIVRNQRHVCLIGGRHLGAVHRADRQGKWSGCDIVVYGKVFGDQRGIGTVVDGRHRLQYPPGC